MEKIKEIVDSEYQNSVKQFRQEQSYELEAERNKIIEEYNRKLKDQIDTLEKQFQQERVKVKEDYQSEIKSLQHQRKSESQDFIRKNKYFYMEHLDEVKKLKS